MDLIIGYPYRMCGGGGAARGLNAALHFRGTPWGVMSMEGEERARLVADKRRQKQLARLAKKKLGKVGVQRQQQGPSRSSCPVVQVEQVKVSSCWDPFHGESVRVSSQE